MKQKGLQIVIISFMKVGHHTKLGSSLLVRVLSTTSQ